VPPRTGWNLRGAISSDVNLSDCRFAFKSPSCQEGELLGSPLARFSKGADILTTPFRRHLIKRQDQSPWWCARFAIGLAAVA
jgi:hypothetical protein